MTVRQALAGRAGRATGAAVRGAGTSVVVKLVSQPRSASGAASLVRYVARLDGFQHAYEQARDADGRWPHRADTAPVVFDEMGEDVPRDTVMDRFRAWALPDDAGNRRPAGRLLDALTRDGRGKTYKKYTRLRVGGVKKRITRFAVSAPPEELVDGYEERKEAFKRELYEDAIAAYDDEQEEANLDPSEVADKIVDDGVSDYVSEHGGNGRRYVDQELIRADFGLSHRDAKATKKIIERTADVGSQNTSAQ